MNGPDRNERPERDERPVFDFRPRRRRSRRESSAGPESLSDLMVPMLSRLGLKSRGRQMQISIAWPEVVGEGVARETRPTWFARGRLTVESSSPALSHQLQLQSQVIIDGLNQRLKEDVVTHLHFKLAPDRS